MSQSGAKNSKDSKYLESPCSIKEAVQIARGVAEDVCKDHMIQSTHVTVALSIQVELIKSIMFEKGIISEEEFKEAYMKKVEEFNDMQALAKYGATAKEDSEDTPKMELKVNDVEVKKV